eukprot:3474957-Rhodomonas_salina.2
MRGNGVLAGTGSRGCSGARSGGDFARTPPGPGTILPTPKVKSSAVCVCVCVCFRGPRGRQPVCVGASGRTRAGVCVGPRVCVGARTTRVQGLTRSRGLARAGGSGRGAPPQHGRARGVGERQRAERGRAARGLLPLLCRGV